MLLTEILLTFTERSIERPLTLFARPDAEKEMNYKKRGVVPHLYLF